jgi:hypothetical protein
MRHVTRHLHFFIRATALIFLWRGAWHLIDSYIFPTNPALSGIVTLVIGAVLIVIADTALSPGVAQMRREEKKADSTFAPQE